MPSQLGPVLGGMTMLSMIATKSCKIVVVIVVTVSMAVGTTCIPMSSSCNPISAVLHLALRDKETKAARPLDASWGACEKLLF